VIKVPAHMQATLDMYAKFEPARHKAEVAWFVRQAKDKGREWAERFLAQVANKRGQDAADKLRQDGRKAWNQNT
jgi:hypothetical protein